MVTSSLLKLIIADQQSEFILPVDYIPREAESKILSFSSNPEVIVLTGLRRAGKSVLLHHIRKQTTDSDYYFNFEDERLATFTVQDFQTLQEVFVELFSIQKIYYFDEIQNIPGWEMFVRRLYNQGNKIYMAGSNANLFSEELGTRLTGRYIPVSIYPISFHEYVCYKNKLLLSKLLTTLQIGQLKRLFVEYTLQGGIPEYIKYQQAEYLSALYDSIIYRDIIARYKISNDIGIKKLVYFLASHCGKEITYNALRKLLDIGSVTTVSDYCQYLEKSYLCFFVNRYSDSLKTQLQSPKKIYFIDHIIAKTMGFRISEDRGRFLENLVFIELKRRNHEVYYYRETKECDFIVRENLQTVQVIQVCQSLSDPKTKKREIEGLLDAMKRFSLKEGRILTEDEELVENINMDAFSFKISILPVWKWLLSLS